MFCKKKQSMSVWKMIEAMLAVFGAVSAAFFVFKLLKKHLGCRCEKDVCRGDKETLGDNWYDLGLDDSLHVCGHQPPPSDDNDLKCDENSVANCENRSVNIENAK